MKIWFVEIGEPLPLEKNVRPHRYGNFCRYLASRGHEVTWFASNFSHMPKKYFSEKTECIDINGYKLWLIESKGYKHNVSLSRILHNKKFAKDFYNLAKKQEPPDIIISPIPTIENSTACLLLAKQWGIPVVADIRDEWPDELVNLLPTQFRFLGRFVLGTSFRKMKKFCQHADGIMGVTKRQRDYGLKFAGRNAMKMDYVFPLGYPDILISDSELANAKEKVKFPFNNYKMNVCFFGTLGRYFEFDSLYAVAKKMTDVGFVIAGDGDNKQELLKKIKILPNVYLPGWVNSPEIKYITQQCQVGLAPYIGSDAFSMPNKIFEYMSNRLAICTTIKGELGELLSKEKIGFNFSAHDSGSLFSALNIWLNNPKQLEEAQNNSRRIFELQFSHEVVFKNAEEYLKRIINNTN